MIVYAPEAFFFLARSARDLFEKQTYFMAKHAQNKMRFCQQCDIALSLTLAAPISKCFRHPCHHMERVHNARHKSVTSIMNTTFFNYFQSEVIKRNLPR